MSEWFKSEQSGYGNLLYKDVQSAVAEDYPYHLLNYLYGWRFLKDRFFGKTLSFGGARCSELSLIASKISDLVIIEPDTRFWSEDKFGIKLEYIEPYFDGHLDFASNTFDTITCFGVLHHIPNATYVFSELIRVLKPGGVILLREPIISMNDKSTLFK